MIQSLHFFIISCQMISFNPPPTLGTELSRSLDTAGLMPPPPSLGQSSLRINTSGDITRSLIPLGRSSSYSIDTWETQHQDKFPWDEALLEHRHLGDTTSGLIPLGRSSLRASTLGRHNIRTNSLGTKLS